VPEEPSDAQLVARVAGGDRDALVDLYRRHAGWISLRLSRRCPDPDLVDTALQDTFVAVWRSAGTWRPTGEVGGWLWSIAVRRLIDGLRRRRPPEPVAEVAAAAVPSAEDAAFAGDPGDAYRTLSPELRAVLDAVVLDQLTTKEAAHLLGIPHGTVKTRLLRARAQLRERYA
jgi:RNA polymerase sigma-70 factor (ECF subfamily)